MVGNLRENNPELTDITTVQDGWTEAVIPSGALRFVQTALALGIDEEKFARLCAALDELGVDGMLQRLTPPKRPAAVSLARPFRLQDKIDPRLVMTDVRAQSWKDVVSIFCDAVAATLANPTATDADAPLVADTLLSDLTEHFRKGGESFGWFLGTGVGVPHAFINGLAAPVVAIVRLRQPLVGLETPDDVPVRLLFFLLEPLNNVESHLLLLARIAHICGTVGNLGLLMAAAGPESLLDCITALDYDIRNGQR